MQRVGLFVLFLAACGDDGGSKVNIIDSGMTVDSPPVSVDCKASSAYGTVTPTTQDAYSGEFDGDPNLWIFLDLNTDPTPDILLVDLYSGYGAFENGFPTAGASIQLTGDEVHPASCGACVSIQVDYTENGPADDYYLADGGTLNLTSATPTSLAGNLSNVTFKHMNIDDSGLATPHPDGCTATLTSLAFSATPTADTFAKPRFSKRARR